MSRIGKTPIRVPDGVQIDYRERHIHVKGPKGENAYTLPAMVDLEIDDGTIEVRADYENDPRARAMMGTMQAVVQNLVRGVSEGFTERLTLNGVGYRAQLNGNRLEMTLGLSHPVRFELPEGVSAQVEGNNQVVLTSHDKVLLGHTCAKIRSFRPPEPYQAKGVLYAGERVRRKAGKSGKK